MNEMGTESVFPIRIDDATVPLVKLVLCDDESHQAKRLRDALAGWGTTTLRIGDAQYMQDALVAYANNEVREGSATHKKALHFAAALEDCVIVAEARANASKEEEPKSIVTPEAEVARLEKERTDRLRDEMLRQVFLGGPRKKIDIWGNVVEDEAPVSKHEFRKMAKTISNEDFRDALRKDLEDKRRREMATAGGSAMNYETLQRIRFNRKPVADVEADKVLTGGSSMNYNEDMKVEGATTLLKQQQQSSPVGRLQNGGVVVGTVSGFRNKTR